MGAPIAPSPRKPMMGMRGANWPIAAAKARGGDCGLRIPDCGLRIAVEAIGVPRQVALGMRTTLRFSLPSVHAVRAIYTALQGIEGIIQADVSRQGATIEHDGRATAELLREAVGAAGYDVLEVLEEKRRLAVKEVEVVEDVEVIEELPRRPRQP